MPNDKEHFVGIDVAKDQLDVAILGRKPIEPFANTKRGIANLVRAMKKCKPKLIVVEATGGYEGCLVLALFEAGLPVALVSPQRVRQYARAKGLLAKTDQLDAQVLAEYGKTIHPRLFVGKSEARKRLSTLVGRRKQLNDMLQAEKNCLRTTSVEMKELEGEIYLPELGTLDRKQIAALVGVTPMNRDSGRKRGYRKTKGGRPEVRRALYMATLTGIRYNPIPQTQYEQLVKRGKEKKVAITACMRKMLTILNAMLRDQQPFRYPPTA